MKCLWKHSLGLSILAVLASVLASSWANAQGNDLKNAAGKKEDSAQVYPYVLSVATGTVIMTIDGDIKLPVLHYKEMAAAKTKRVMIRAAWNTQDKRTECNAGIEPITLVGQSGSLKPEKWGDTLSLLLSAFGIKGSSAISFALFDYELVSTSKKGTIPETARLSPWLKVPARLK